jgi:hypothetical protein
MSRQAIEAELRNKYAKEVSGEKLNRTLEDALQEALDNTTPEFPGTPNGHLEEPEEQVNAEWI